ncbi:undecaprenyl/decaprenyl-phosphate alpha-N-acetylglucosaminyl 1-phosphate transferase [Candidatus Collierbacteria bacterium]|nr:undecaprenyl/decaprenyl-phosphate alpha-N-acetylglucosaminyl 1-phosphate transferase [Candidatus Collierbacteria bacterium]
MPFLTALVVTLAITPLTIYLFTKWGFLIDPKKQQHPAHTHQKPVPKGGGIPIFLAVAIVSWWFLGKDTHLMAILLAMLISLVVGVIDDIHGSSPLSRLAFNFLAAGIVVASGIGIAFWSSPFGGVIDVSWPRLAFEFMGSKKEIWLLSDLFALLWIPFLMNAINWSSGIDGQVSGVVAIAAAVVGIISLNYSADITQWPVAILAFALSGAFVGFTFFHFYPQKIMPGYSATSLAGLLLGVLSILSTAKVGTLMVVLSLPLLDAIYTGSRRLLSGRSPFLGDRQHLHHRLLEMGWGKRRVTLFYWGATAVMGYLALVLDARMKLFAILALGLLMLVFITWRFFGNFLNQPGRASG